MQQIENSLLLDSFLISKMYIQKVSSSNGPSPLCPMQKIMATPLHLATLHHSLILLVFENSHFKIRIFNDTGR